MNANKKLTIVFLDIHNMNPGDLDMKPFENLGRIVCYEATDAKDVIERSKEADIIVSNKIVFNKEILEKLPHLKMICVSATGYNEIDLTICRQRGITVSNAPAYSTPSVAQTVFAHILNLSNHTDVFCQHSKKGDWLATKELCYTTHPTYDLAGKTIGIIGYGNIGQQVARIALSFDMQVLVQTSKPASSLPECIYKKEITELLEESDIVTLHIPLTPNNQKMVNNKWLSHLKPSTILINTARGGLIDEEDLANALNNGRLKAYAADVLTVEPATEDCLLWKMPNVYLTPHIAWASYEARQRLLQICANNIKTFLSGKPVNVVN